MREAAFTKIQLATLDLLMVMNAAYSNSAQPSTQIGVLQETRGVYGCL